MTTLASLQAQLENYQRTYNTIRESRFDSDMIKIQLTNLLSSLSDLLKEYDQIRNNSEYQEGLKVFSDQVKKLIDNIRNFHDEKKKSYRASLHMDTEFKRPMTMKGELQKLGEKGIKRWKKRYFKQDGNFLSYYEKIDSTTPKGKINLDKVSEVRKLDKLLFDLVTPDRTYHLQANNESEFQEWISDLKEWVEYVKGQNIGKMFSSFDKNTKIITETQNLIDQEKQKLRENNEKIERLKTEIELSKLKRQQTFGELMYNNLEEIKEKRENINKNFAEIETLETTLANEEDRLDKTTLTVSRDTTELMLDDFKLQRTKDRIYALEEKEASQQSTIKYLQEKINGENLIRPKAIDPNSKLGKLTKALAEKQKINRQLQSTNSKLATDMSEYSSTHSDFHTSKNIMLQCLTKLAEKYKSQYQNLLETYVLSQGGNVSMINEYESLKERYFNSLLIRFKLHYQMSFDISIQLKVEDIYDKFENIDCKEWPRRLEELIIETYNPTQSSTQKMNTSK